MSSNSQSMCAVVNLGRRAGLSEFPGLHSVGRDNRIRLLAACEIISLKGCSIIDASFGPSPPSASVTASDSRRSSGNARRRAGWKGYDEDTMLTAKLRGRRCWKSQTRSTRSLSGICEAGRFGPHVDVADQGETLCQSIRGSHVCDQVLRFEHNNDRNVAGDRFASH